MSEPIHSTIESTIQRKEAWFGFVGISVFIFLLFLHRPLSIFDCVVVIICLLAWLLFAFAVFVPKKFMRGIRLTGDGFEYRAPLKSPKFVRLADIRLIEVFSRGDGPLGEDVPFIIYSSVGKAFLLETDLYQTELLGQLKALSGFNLDEYSKALNHVPRNLDHIFGKRFVVYANRIA